MENIDITHEIPLHDVNVRRQLVKQRKSSATI